MTQVVLKAIAILRPRVVVLCNGEQLCAFMSSVGRSVGRVDRSVDYSCEGSKFKWLADSLSRSTLFSSSWLARLTG